MSISLSSVCLLVERIAVLEKFRWECERKKEKKKTVLVLRSSKRDKKLVTVSRGVGHSMETTEHLGGREFHGGLREG